MKFDNLSGSKSRQRRSAAAAVAVDVAFLRGLGGFDRGWVKGG